MSEENGNKWISIEEAAEYIGVKPVTLRMWSKNLSHAIPAHKVGKLWKYRRSELDLWIQSGRSAISIKEDKEK